MASSIGAPMVSDSLRDAEKYHKLLFAIESATSTINSLERQGRASIDEVLASLLPDLADALDAEQAFVAIYRPESDLRDQVFELLIAHPRRKRAGLFLPWSKPLGQVLTNQHAKVIQLYEDTPGKVIAGLELFGATTAILMQMKIGNQSRIVGVCNRKKPEMGAFLGTDRRALESIIELISIGMRVGERRRQELENIQNISAAINAELNPEELLPLIARMAAEVFSAPAASLMLWDKKQENLIIEAYHGLSPLYVKRQRIPRKSVEMAVAGSKNKRAIVIPDLRKSLFGKANLIQSENLRSALTAQLQVSGEMMGVLNIYSKDAERAFTSGELELAEILANHAAIAIHNANLRQRDLQGLLATSDALKATLDENELLELIVVKVNGVFAAPVSLIFWDEDNKSLVIRATHGLSRNWIGHQVTTSERVLALSQEKKEYRPSLISDPGRPSFGLQRLCQQENLRNALVAPIALPGASKVMGFMVIFGKDEDRPFKSEDLKIAGIIADQAAIAIRTTQFHGENKKRGEQLNALDQIALDITGELKLNIQELLTSIITRATQLVGAKGGIIYQLDGKEGAVHPVAATPGADISVIEIDKNRGLIGEIIRTEAPFGVDNYRRWSKRQLSLDSLGLTAAYGVPILSDNHLLGIIVVHHVDPGRKFSRADRELLKRFANHAAVAIENANIYNAEHEAKDYLDRLIKSSLDGIVTVDRNGWITDYNEGAERICGYSRAEVLEQKTNVYTLYGGSRIPRTIYKILLRQEKMDNYETFLQAKDGQQIPIVLSASLLRDKDQKIRGTVGFFKDLRPLRVTLNTFSDIARASDLDEGLKALAKGMVRGTNITFCQILTREPNEQRFRVRAAYAMYRDRSLGQPVIWNPELGKLVEFEDAAPLLPLLESDTPKVCRRGELQNGIAITNFARTMAGLQVEVQSVLLMPLKSNQGVFGICILGEERNWDRSPFNEEKISLVRSIAEQGAELIHRLHAYEALRLREGLLKAGKEITSLQDLTHIMKAIADNVRIALNCDLVTLYTFEAAKSRVDLPTISGTLVYPEAIHSLGYVNKNSLVWKILELGEPHFADDAVHDPIMMPLATADPHPSPGPFVVRERISSSAGIPLVMGNEKIGILFASFRSPHPFNEQEKNDILIFATQAAMAIYNARLYQEVRKTKDYLLTSQAVAWLGLYAADLQHTIHQKAFSLENIASGLREWVQRLEPPPEGIEDVRSSLDGLDALSNNIRAVKITNQILELPGDAGTWTYIEIDEEIRTMCEKLLQGYPEVEREIDLRCPGVKVMIAPEGLQVAMEKLVHNATKAMAGKGRIRICTEKVGRMVHIRVSDTGRGIPEESLPYFLTRMVPRKRKEEGTGTGVLIARFVALSHGGDLELVSTSPAGTELQMMLPSAGD